MISNFEIESENETKLMLATYESIYFKPDLELLSAHTDAGYSVALVLLMLQANSTAADEIVSSHVTRKPDLGVFDQPNSNRPT